MSEIEIYIYVEHISLVMRFFKQLKLNIKCKSYKRQNII